MWAVALALVSGMGLACGQPGQGDEGGTGSSGSTDSGTGSGDSVAELVEESVVAYCEQYFDCSCNTLNPRYDSVEDCITVELADVMGLHETAAGYGLQLDAECFRERADRHALAGCDPAWPEPVDCKVHYGEKQLGESCTLYDDAEGDDCAVGLVCFYGVCEVPLEEYAAGDPCPLNPADACETGALCLDQDGDGVYVCQSLPQAGEGCLIGFCGEGLLCLDEVCVEAPGLGEPCSAEPVVCDPCLDCDEDTDPPTCAVPPKGLPGEPCIGFKCVEGAWCNGDTGATCSTDPVVCWSASDLPFDPLSAKVCEHVG